MNHPNDTNWNSLNFLIPHSKIAVNKTKIDDLVRTGPVSARTVPIKNDDEVDLFQVAYRIYDELVINL